MRIACLAATAISLLPLSAYADPETEALRAQIKLLEARLNALEQKQRTKEAFTAPAPAPSAQLENRVAVLERKDELAAEEAKAKAEKNPAVEVSKKGLSITSADKQYALKLNGYTHLDNRTFFEGEAKGDDEFLARRIRPILTFQAGKDFSFRLMPDFAGSISNSANSSTRVFDVHADYRYMDGLQFRVGKFKPPVGLERLQSAADTMFAERGHPTNLAPSRDFGAMIYGEPWAEVEYQLGIFNGAADLANNDGDDDNHKDIAARVFVSPFKNSNTLALQGLGLGVGGSFGEHDGTTAITQLPSYRTPGQRTFFAYSSGAFADGDAWRIYPQGYYYYNNFGLLAEYALSAQEVRLGGFQDTLTHTAWQVAGSYVLTGEDATFKGSVKPLKNFNPRNNGWGAFELAARVGQTDIDNDAFPRFANISTQASRVRSYGTGINWYLNENVKLVLDYDFSTFDGGAAAGSDRDDEQVLISRAQFRF